jgi:hypothetical protein
MEATALILHMVRKARVLPVMPLVLLSCPAAVVPNHWRVYHIGLEQAVESSWMRISATVSPDIPV